MLFGKYCNPVAGAGRLIPDQLLAGMKIPIFVIVIIALFIACDANNNVRLHTQNDLVFSEQDRLLADRLFMQLKHMQKYERGTIMLHVARQFMGTPYVAHTLETGPEEKLVINLSEMDCTTFIEYSLAMARTIKSGSPDLEKFVGELEKIRYRHGKRDGYLSRLHYFSEWILDNGRRGNIKDVSREIAHILYPNKIDFMSQHAGSYQVLKENPELVLQISKLEESLSQEVFWYIPKGQFSSFGEMIQDGDIIAFTTHIAGLDVIHTGIAIREDGQLKLLHASSVDKEVVISSGTLAEYLQNSRNASGVMVARPQ